MSKKRLTGLCCRFFLVSLFVGGTALFSTSPNLYAGNINWGPSFGFKAADIAKYVQMSVLLSNMYMTDPPLPMTNYRQGDYKLTVMPSYFTIDKPIEFAAHGSASNPMTETKREADIDGFALGVGGSWAFRPHWGLYFFGIGNKLSGPIRRDTRDLTAGTYAYDIDGDAWGLNVSAGLVYEFFGNKPAGFSIPVFAGPSVSYYSAKNRFISRHTPYSPSPEDLDPTTQVHGDLDVKASAVQPGLMGGVETRLNMGKNFALNPFVIAFTPLKTSNEVEITVNSAVGYTATSRFSIAPGTTDTATFNTKTIIGGGINLTYRPWGLTASLTGVFISKDIATQEGLEVSRFSMAKSFGNYQK